MEPSPWCPSMALCNPFDTVMHCSIACLLCTGAALSTTLHSISWHSTPTMDMVSEYGFEPAYNPRRVLDCAALPHVSLFSSSARLVEYTVQQTHPTQPQPTQSHPANATLRGALRVAASVRGVVERMREERQTGVQQGQGRAQQGEGQEAQGGEVQRGKGQGEGEEAEVREEKGGMGEDGTNADGSMGGEWWEGMENEEELENAMKQLVVWAGGHASPEMLAMAAAVWHWIDTGRGGHASPEMLAMAAAVWHWVITGRGES
ncbi:unnamed protein product [Closterium sp. NIES-53]